jgi:hypothetical protein
MVTVASLHDVVECVTAFSSLVLTGLAVVTYIEKKSPFPLRGSVGALARQLTDHMVLRWSTTAACDLPLAGPSAYCQFTIAASGPAYYWQSSRRLS